MKFIITNIVKERSVTGRTIYFAKAEDGIVVEATFMNNNLPDRASLKEMFDDCYNQCKKLFCTADVIRVGDTIE